MILERSNHILGREKEKAALVAALKSDKIFPTWIFHGPFGVGKASVAMKFAKRLLSDTVGDVLEMDQDDPIHKLVDSRIHPDFFILEQSDESVSIDDTRKLLTKVRKSPSLSKRRVVILENSSSLNKNICNSLLKILEEPPENTVIIMICDNIGTIPKTLLSRAVKIYFPPLEESLVKQVLDGMNIRNSEKLARLSEGSVGYALRLNDNNGVEIYDDILKGFSSPDDYLKTVKKIVDNKLCDNFKIIRTSLLRALKIYVDILNDVADENFKEEIDILKPLAAAKDRPDREIKKIQEIIGMINLCEPAALDKNAVVLNAYERFFK
jgi:DNA polymerase III delta prime subunit